MFPKATYFTKYLVGLLFWFGIIGAANAQQTVGVFQNTPAALNGYTLIAPSSAKNTFLIDNCGNVVNTWTSLYNPALGAYLLEDGRLLRTARIQNDFTAGGSGGRIEVFSWENELLWSYNYSSDLYHQHHDVEYLPNGNILILAWEFHSYDEAIQAGRNPDNLSPNGLWAEQIVEVEMIGTDSINIVWKWSLWDHLIQDFDPTKDNFGIVKEHPELMDLNYVSFQNPGSLTDWVHLNSVDYNPELDQILLSSRHLHEIWIIDHSTTTAQAAGHTGGNAGKGGDLLYRWGNPATYQHNDTGERFFYGQHDANWIQADPNNLGKIMVFNNGIDRVGPAFSSVDVIQPPLNQSGQYDYTPGLAYAPAELDWTYQADPPTSLFSSTVSGAQRLSNGNTLICEGNDGFLLEIDPQNEPVWVYVNPASINGPTIQGQNPVLNTLFRAYRYAPEFPAFEGKDLSPGPPIELEPINENCLIYGDSISPTQLIPTQRAAFVLVQNPFSEQIFVENPNQQSGQVRIFNASGQLFYQGIFLPHAIEIPATDWPKGLYFIQIQTLDGAVRWIQKAIKQ